MTGNHCISVVFGFCKMFIECITGINGIATHFITAWARATHLMPICGEIVVWLGGNEESFSKHVDVIAARGQLSDLQLKLESTETRRKRARIEHERDMETVRQDRQVLFTYHMLL